MDNTFWKGFSEAANNFFDKNQREEKNPEVIAEEMHSNNQEVRDIEEGVRERLGLGKRVLGTTFVAAGIFLRNMDGNPQDDNDMFDKLGKSFIEKGQELLGTDHDILGIVETFKNDPFKK